MLKKINKWFAHGTGLLVRSKKLKQIRKNGNPTAAMVANVCEALIHGTYDPEEKQVLNRINDLRSRLCTSEEILHFKKIWEPEESTQFNQEADIAVKDMASTAAIPERWGTFHFRLLRTFEPAKSLELGTNLGISASYLASALHLNKSGQLITLEGIPSFAKVAARGIEELNVSNTTIITGLFTETLEKTLKQYGSFDYVFIDGHHQKKPTLAYFEMIKPYLAENAIVVFDDIYWSDGMLEAWKEVIEEEHVQVAFDFYKLGIVIYNSSQKKQTDKYRIAMYL